MNRQERLWQAMTAMGPVLMPIFTQQRPTLAGGVENQFASKEWAKAVTGLSSELNDAYEAILEQKGLPR